MYYILYRLVHMFSECLLHFSVKCRFSRTGVAVTLPKHPLRYSISLPKWTNKLKYKINFAPEIEWKLEEQIKYSNSNILRVRGKEFILRGILQFSGPDRSGLRISNGHLSAFCYRSNDTWDVHDDTQIKTLFVNKKKKS